MCSFLSYPRMFRNCNSKHCQNQSSRVLTFVVFAGSHSLTYSFNTISVCYLRLVVIFPYLKTIYVVTNILEFYELGLTFFGVWYFEIFYVWLEITVCRLFTSGPSLYLTNVSPSSFELPYCLQVWIVQHTKFIHVK